jgi:hypothetical protein
MAIAKVDQAPAAGEGDCERDEKFRMLFEVQRSEGRAVEHPKRATTMTDPLADDMASRWQ